MDFHVVTAAVWLSGNIIPLTALELSLFIVLVFFIAMFIWVLKVFDLSL